MTEQQIELSPVQALLIIGLFGVYGIFVPNPWDIGETILSAVNYASTCTTDFCKENSDRLLKYYNLGTILMMPSGFGLALYVYKNNR